MTAPPQNSLALLAPQYSRHRAEPIESIPSLRMNNTPEATEPKLEIDLREPAVAAVLAWLIPGAGHLYQRRTGKGLLFMICILGTYFFGLALGEGKVVYASWNQVDRRWQFPLQAGVGMAAIPAVVQSMNVRRGDPPIMGGIMVPPRTQEDLANWHYVLAQRFDIGTLYTMVAGLLNILAIWDAYGGPVITEPGRERGPPDNGKKDKK